MSVVAVKVYDNKIKIAADSIVERGGSKRTDNGFSKLIKVNNMIIGGVGYCEEQSLLFHYSETHKPASASEKDMLAFLVEFSEYKSAITGSSKIENDYIIVYDNKVFSICSLFVNEIKNYDAIGAGMDFANAALYLGHNPKEAVKVACELSCFVADPIVEYEVKF